VVLPSELAPSKACLKRKTGQKEKPLMLSREIFGIYLISLLQMLGKTLISSNWHSGVTMLLTSGTKLFWLTY
jgi:hypothetical protein